MRNWQKKGKEYLDRMVVELKRIALEKVAVVNCGGPGARSVNMTGTRNAICGFLSTRWNVWLSSSTSMVPWA